MISCLWCWSADLKALRTVARLVKMVWQDQGTADTVARHYCLLIKVLAAVRAQADGTEPATRLDLVGLAAVLMPNIVPAEVNAVGLKAPKSELRVKRLLLVTMATQLEVRQGAGSHLLASPLSR